MLVGIGLTLGVLLPYTTLAALALLVAFTAYIVVVLTQPADERPRCACFGALSKAPVGQLSLVRNVALVALGALALAS